MLKLGNHKKLNNFLCAPTKGPASACVHTARPRNAHKERQARNMQPDSNTQITAHGIQHERSTIGSREVVSLGTPISDRLFSTLPVGAHNACPPWRAAPGLRLGRCLCSGALQGGLFFLRPHARLPRLAPFITSLRTRPEPIRSAHHLHF
jgi:hypothetical protein